MDIADFIRARLDEDEWRAQAGKDAAEKRTHYRADMLRSCERDLRDVAAKRSMVDECVRTLASEDTGLWLAERMLELLAVRYADHRDYEAAWKPSE